MKQKILTIYAAVTSGLLVGAGTAFYYWNYTQKDVLEIAIVAGFAGFMAAAAGIAFFETDEPEDDGEDDLYD